MPQAKRLIAAVLINDNQSAVSKAIAKVDYYMKRNFIAYKSHCKKKLLMLLPEHAAYEFVKELNNFSL